MGGLRLVGENGAVVELQVNLHMVCDGLESLAYSPPGLGAAQGCDAMTIHVTTFNYQCAAVVYANAESASKA